MSVNDSNAAFVGTRHHGGVCPQCFRHFAVALRRGECRFAARLLFLASLCQLAVGEQHVDGAAGNVDFYGVAVAHQPDCAACRRFRRDVAYRQPRSAFYRPRVAVAGPVNSIWRTGTKPEGFQTLAAMVVKTPRAGPLEVYFTWRTRAMDPDSLQTVRRTVTLADFRKTTADFLAGK